MTNGAEVLSTFKRIEFLLMPVDGVLVTCADFSDSSVRSVMRRSRLRWLASAQPPSFCLPLPPPPPLLRLPAAPDGPEPKLRTCGREGRAPGSPAPHGDAPGSSAADGVASLLGWLAPRPAHMQVQSKEAHEVQ